MRDYDELKALIEKRGVHAEFGDAGEGFLIEQNPHELATFLVRMQELGVTSCLEIGTGYKGGLSRFLAHDMGWQVTSYDIKDYGHKFPGVEYIVGDEAWLNVEYPHFLERFDLVFIDANHAYDEVKFDFEYYGKYAAKAIAFHDVAGLRDCEGVKRFWDEIAAYPSEIYFKAGGENKRVMFLKSGYSQTIDAFSDNGKHASGIGWIEL